MMLNMSSAQELFFFQINHIVLLVHVWEIHTSCIIFYRHTLMKSSIVMLSHSVCTFNLVLFAPNNHCLFQQYPLLLINICWFFFIIQYIQSGFCHVTYTCLQHTYDYSLSLSLSPSDIPKAVDFILLMKVIHFRCSASVILVLLYLSSLTLSIYKISQFLHTSSLSS